MIYGITATIKNPFQKEKQTTKATLFKSEKDSTKKVTAKDLIKAGVPIPVLINYLKSLQKITNKEVNKND